MFLFSLGSEDSSPLGTEEETDEPLDGSFYLDVHESVVAKVIADPSWPHF